MPTQEQLRTLSLAGLACLQTKYETECNDLSEKLRDAKIHLFFIGSEIRVRKISPDANYPEERTPFYG